MKRGSHYNIIKYNIVFNSSISRDGLFVDDVTSISAASFHSPGVKCPCPCQYTSYNKATFPQHCKTKKHKKWLNELCEKHDGIIRESIDRGKEIKDLRIRMEQLVRENKRLKKHAATHDEEKRAQSNNYEERIEELEAERNGANEAYESVLGAYNKVVRECRSFRCWFKIGASEIMDWEVPDDDDDSVDETQ